MITTELKSHFLRLYQMAFSDDNCDYYALKTYTPKVRTLTSYKDGTYLFPYY
ncbi:hypothetical protein [Psychroserpens jangbogonensis]|uniref:hypothetical protein n=1 Tax=Psychroserpens jangbogonensis TaxID=1484460 RepID=UPI000A7B81D5|nr:hypothetical protein [Psychroserpens jangbogonensis]